MAERILRKWRGKRVGEQGSKGGRKGGAGKGGEQRKLRVLIFLEYYQLIRKNALDKTKIG